MSRWRWVVWFRSAAAKFIERAQIVVALFGSAATEQDSPWMDGLMQFVQVDAGGRPEPLEDEPVEDGVVLLPPWTALRERARKLLQIRQ